jgi:hypothetical protein
MSLRLLSSWVFFLFVSPITISGLSFALHFRVFAVFGHAGAEDMFHVAHRQGFQNPRVEINGLSKTLAII